MCARIHTKVAVAKWSCQLWPSKNHWGTFKIHLIAHRRLYHVSQVKAWRIFTHSVRHRQLPQCTSGSHTYMHMHTYKNFYIAGYGMKIWYYAILNSAENYI